MTNGQFPPDEAMSGGVRAAYPQGKPMSGRVPPTRRWTVFQAVLFIYAGLVVVGLAVFILAGKTQFAVLTGFALAVTVGLLVGSMRKPYPVSEDSGGTD